MTERQLFGFYFPEWNRCCRANGWRIKGGQLQVDTERLSEEGRKVFALARQRALAQERPANMDDLRHAVHIVALKRDKSSEHLSNAELDRVVCLFHVLEDPDWLGDDRKSGMMHWLAYERGEDPGAAKRVDWFIANVAPEEYTRAICRDKFGANDWRGLNAFQKDQLAKTLSERRRAKMRPVQSPRSKVQSPMPVQQEFAQPAAAAAGPRVMVMNPHKIYTKGPF